MQCKQRVVLAVKVLDLFILSAECADDTRTRQALAGGAQYALEIFLHFFEQRDSRQQNREYHCEQQRYHNGENDRTANVNGKGKDHRAEYHDGRAHEQAQRDVDARLHLVYVAAHAGEDVGNADGVEIAVCKVLDFGIHVAAQILRHADSGFCREVLRDRRAEKADAAEQHEDQAHFEDIGLVSVFDAHVYKVFDDQRHQQFKGCFQHLEQRRKDRHPLVLCKVL